MSSFKTAPPQDVHPWKCVWRNGDGIRCHIGRIFDQELLQSGGEFIQNRFPRKKPITVTLIGGITSNASGDANVSPGAQGSGTNTGGVKVYYAPTFGRATPDTAGLIAVPAGTGYAYWPEGLYRQRGSSVYVILKKEEPEEGTPKWILSLVSEGELDTGDIKIAHRLAASCVQLWQSDIMPTAVMGAPECFFPFKIEVDQSNGAYVVNPGSINGNVVGPTFGTCPDGGSVGFTAVATESSGSITGGRISTSGASGGI